MVIFIIKWVILDASPRATTMAAYNVPDISTHVSFPEPPKTTMLPWGTDRNLQGPTELESSRENLWGEMGQEAGESSKTTKSGQELWTGIP